MSRLQLYILHIYKRTRRRRLHIYCLCSFNQTNR